MHSSADLLSSIGICVTAAAVLALVASRLKQPLILAYLCAGVVIGPAMGFGWIHDQQSIHGVSEIGLILLLFLIGMELDLRKLAAAGKAVILTGFLQFLLCFGLGMGFYRLLGFGWSSTEFSLFYLAGCLGLSSTMIVVKILYEKNELATLPGRITLGVLVFQDIWAIVILAVQPNLLNPHLSPLLASLGKSVLLVAVTVAVSRWALPPIFRSVAKQPELMLATSLAWCFAVCGGSTFVGLSREMGALIAGVSLSAFPYNLDVIAKVVSIRDFFVTLFFVALGMQIPEPTLPILKLAAISSAFLLASRLITVFPLLRVARLGHRAGILPAVNLAQLSEFSLVIASLGAAQGHIPGELVSMLIFVFVITSVWSTYLIGYNDRISRRLSALLIRAGLKDVGALDEREEQTHLQDKDIIVLGFYLQASALLHEWEIQNGADSSNPWRQRVLVIDFNPLVHSELRRRNIACVYGDLANMETLHHAQIHEAALILLTIPDSILRGTSNRRLLQQSRRLSPNAKVIVTAERVTQALELYQDGADFVFLTNLHSARDRVAIIKDGLRDGFGPIRNNHLEDLRHRNEVLA